MEVRGSECDLSAGASPWLTEVGMGRRVRADYQPAGICPETWFGRFQGTSVRDHRRTWIPQELLRSCGAEWPRHCRLVAGCSERDLISLWAPSRPPRDWCFGLRCARGPRPRAAPVPECSTLGTEGQLRRKAIRLPGHLFHTTRPGAFEQSCAWRREWESHFERLCGGRGRGYARSSSEGCEKQH